MSSVSAGHVTEPIAGHFSEAKAARPALHIPSLDGLRTVSFLIVFVAHAGLDHVVPGGFGVTVFFFLSGFLITTLLRREFDKAGSISLRNFYVRRALRILPPFYLVLALAIILSAAGVLGGAFDWGAVAAQSLYYANYWIVFHGYGGLPPGTGVYWSLAVEEHFYLLFPFIYLAFRRLSLSPRAQAIVLGALCAASLLWREVLVRVLDAPFERTSVASDTRFDSILFGCALAVYGNPALDPPKLAERTWKYVLFPLGIAGLLASFLVREPVFRETLRYSLQGVSLIPVFVCAIRFPTWLPMRPLNYRPVAFVGVLSYSLYLLHQVVLFAVAHQTPARLGPVAQALVALGVSFGAAWAMHELIEKPSARLRRRFNA